MDAGIPVVARMALRGVLLGRGLLKPALCLVFAVIVIKAASADLTWDEAWTYLHYGRTPLGFTQLDLANDHPLNSILVWASTWLFGNSEFIIRIPNVLAGGLYLAATARLVRGARLKVLAFAICVLQPYLIDYFSLARGYGLAVALVQCGLVAGFFADAGRQRLATMLGCWALASFAIFSTVVALYALIGAHLVDAWRHRRETGGAVSGLRISLAFGALGLLPVAGLLWVSRDGLPLVGSSVGFFDAVPRAVAADVRARPLGGDGGGPRPARPRRDPAIGRAAPRPARDGPADGKRDLPGGRLGCGVGARQAAALGAGAAALAAAVRPRRDRDGRGFARHRRRAGAALGRCGDRVVQPAARLVLRAAPAFPALLRLGRRLPHPEPAGAVARGEQMPAALGVGELRARSTTSIAGSCRNTARPTIPACRPEHGQLDRALLKPKAGSFAAPVAALSTRRASR